MEQNSRKEGIRRIALGRLPAVPLITCDPYFSLWSGSDCLTGTDAMHWTGRRKRVAGTARIDGREYRFMGLGEAEAMEQTALSVTALHSVYRFQDAGVELAVDFWTPLLLEDLDILSRPCSYVDMAVRSMDGKSHMVEVVLEFDGELCCDKGQTGKIGGGCYAPADSRIAWMGLREQSPLGYSGDSVTIDWGYLYLAAAEAEPLEVVYAQDAHSLRAKAQLQAKPGSWEKVSLVAAYDDIASIQYFGRMLPGYWARNGKNIHDMISEALEEHDSLLRRCEAFETAMERDAMEFSPSYTKICIAAYRQSIAAHKLIADEDGNPVFISKECHSNGCAATVDVTYPSAPLFFLYNPELVRGMMRPVFRFAKLPIWNFDFAPHDAGRYPHVTGQVYGYRQKPGSIQYLEGEAEPDGHRYPMLWQMPTCADIYDLRYQMPIEECGNMLILEAALARLDSERAKEELQQQLPLFETWAEYLLQNGANPGQQLCTDDYAGHIDHNINLAMKAVMGVEAYAILLETAQRTDQADLFHEKAREMARDVYTRALGTDHTKFTFDAEEESWSLKYNAVWDLAFGTKLWDEDFYQQEIALYHRKRNAYGVPLYSIESYTKSDWMIWAASLDGTGRTVEEFSGDILRFLEESPDRVPFTDWYMTEEARQCPLCSFQNRTVQGAMFMPLLLKRMTTR
nr:DUF4965 domain-containing protein [uncultured Acetatifactor sp.]